MDRCRTNKRTRQNAPLHTLVLQQKVGQTFVDQTADEVNVKLVTS